MDCNNCGAALSNLTCEYCGAYNPPITIKSESDEKDLDELSYEIALIESKIAQLSGMPIPEKIKERKLFLLEEKLSELKKL
mgnify:CR=1 FL=1|jgi:hypothetical protein|tara:strand:- start:462 stop:704 length:243 start_codon:yes stop_codon:yes gene_type:complete